MIESWAGSTGRKTRQRRQVASALKSEKRPISAQDLFLQLRGKGSAAKVSLATVYRTLNGLVTTGLVDTFKEDSGETLYLLCERGHHHHLSCRMCGKVVDIRDCKLDGWASQVAKDHGFSTIEHRAELVGTCASCKEAG